MSPRDELDKVLLEMWRHVRFEQGDQVVIATLSGNEQGTVSLLKEISTIYIWS